METKNDPCPCGVSGCSGSGELLQVQLPGMAVPVTFSRAELTQLVQQAADVHNIRATEPTPAPAPVIPSQRAAS